MVRGVRANDARGFTLLEVVVALLVLEAVVLGALGTLVVAARTVARAERLERAAGRTEAVLDSLRGGAAPASVSESLGDVLLTWEVDGDGRVAITATDPQGGTLLRARSRVPVR